MKCEKSMVDQEKITKKIKDRTFSAADLPELFEVFSKIVDDSEDLRKSFENWDRKFYFNLGGPADFWLKVEDCKLSSGKGKIESPDVTYTISEEKAINMFTAQMDGSHLSTSGDVKIEGDFSDGSKLGIASGLILGELDIAVPEKPTQEAEEKKKPYLLTRQDNKKIRKSWAAKGDAIIKGGAWLNELTPETKYSIGLRIEEHAEKYSDDLALLYEDVKYTHKEE